jgi:hypothetical protein
VRDIHDKYRESIADMKKGQISALNVLREYTERLAKTTSTLENGGIDIGKQQQEVIDRINKLM